MALKQSSFSRVLLFALVLMAQPAPAQISAWKLGGAGLSWSESDTTRLFIDFVSAPGSIQPIYLTPEKTVFSHLDNWVFWRDPSDIVLGYVDGEILRTWVAPAEIIESEDGLLVRLPARVTRADNPPLRLFFSTALFSFATTFTGEVSDSEREVLPQPVGGGDAGQALSTNSLHVLGTADSVSSVVQELSVSTPVLTPNGDGVHDRLQIRYTLFRLPELVPVALEIYALDGRRLVRIDAGRQAAGPQETEWDGRDERGELLPPGVYLLSVAPNAEFATSAQILPLGIAY